MIGTPIYCPAEILKGDKAIDPFLADLWALGITSYYVSYYQLPFGLNEMDCKTFEDVKEKITRALVFPDNPKRSNKIKEFLAKLL